MSLQKIVYLSNAQLQELFTNGSVTSGGITINYSDDDMYITPSGEIADVQVDGETVVNSEGIAVIPAIHNVPVGGDAGQILVKATGNNFAMMWADKIPTVNVSGTTPTITAQADYRYVCGEVATLDFTPSSTGICDVVFTSGATATVLTVPNTIKWANGFDPTSLEANTTYEINIMDGLGVAVGWT